MKLEKKEWIILKNNNMKPISIQIIETCIVLACYLLSYFATKTTINNVLKNTHLQRARRKIMIKAINLLLSITALVLISAIWSGVKRLTVLSLFIKSWNLVASFINCDWSSPKYFLEVCKLVNQRPPARVIAYACPKWEDKDEVPF